MIKQKLKNRWVRFWMRYAGLSPLGRISTRLAALQAPPYTARMKLAHMNKSGYIDPNAILNHDDLSLGDHIFIADRVVLNQVYNGGILKLGNKSAVLRDTIIATGHGQEGSVTIGNHTVIQPRCQIMGYKGPIRIGDYVHVAPTCAIYSYNHGFAAGELIGKQPLYTKGGITIGDDVWLGYGVVVLDGVSIGSGAVIGARSVVSKDIPANAIASGMPAVVRKMRE
jgi:acetyltransferase-like isoleucine patch superfamily enzyme